MKKDPSPYRFALIVMIIICFLLGFITTLNNSMIDFCKQTFQLSEFQGQLVNTAFYGAYILSIPLALLMNRLGYKKTLLAGLVVVALGFILNYAGIGIFADNALLIYPVYLGCMFLVATGIVLLQLVINPYVKALGTPESSASRMTLSQAFNSLGTTIAPIFVSVLIVSGAGGYTPDSVKIPFLGLGIFTLVLGLILLGIKLPVIREEEQQIETGQQYKSSVFQYPHVWFGGLAIFMYIGVEVGIPSLMPFKVRALMADGVLASDFDPTRLLSFYWGGLLLGRALGTLILWRVSSRKVLSSCLLTGIACVILTLVLPGKSSIYAMILTGLFHSVLWPLIFDIALTDLGPHTKMASGVVTTGVIGAAILTPLMGKIAEGAGFAIALSLFFIYYLYILLFSARLSKIRPKAN